MSNERDQLILHDVWRLLKDLTRPRIEVAMLRRIMFVSVFGVGVCCLAENGHAQETKSVRWSHEYIISVNADMLADFIFPGCSALTASPRFDGVGVVRKYRRAIEGDEVEVIIGIYPSEEAASVAGGRMMPERPLGGAENRGGGHFFSARGCHMRIQNVVVVVLLGDCWTKNCGPARDDQAAQEEMAYVARALESALHDVRVIRGGRAVNALKLRVLDVTRVPRFGPETDVGYKIALTVDGEPDVLFTRGWGYPQVRKREDGRYEVAGGRHPWYGDMAIRAARPTGEVCVFPVEDLVDSATKVELGWRGKRDIRIGRGSLARLERADIIVKLSRGEGGVHKQSIFAEYLTQEPTADCVPLFLEILSSDRHGEIKKFALRGLAEMRRKEGLPNYREYAADRTQPRVVRRDAIMLIREFGTEQDLALLRRLGEEIKTWPVDDNEDPMLSSHETRAVFSRAVSSAIRRLEAKFSDD